MSRALVLLGLLAGLLSCAANPPLQLRASPDRTAGTAQSIERIGGYRHGTLRLLFWWQGLDEALPTEYGVDLYRLVYLTHAPDGRLVPASGLVALPRGAAHVRGLLSWQHGTTSLRADAPSSLHLFNGVLPAAVFAGHGYVLLAPDYLGMGVSQEPQEYYLTQHMAGVVTDFLRAARSVLDANGIAVPQGVLLAGFSQGAHAALATQRALEHAPVPGLQPIATASIAGPVDLPGLGVRGALAGRSRFSSLYLAWLARSHAQARGEPLDTALRPEWSNTARVLFDGEHDADATVAALPAQPRELMTDAFLRAFDGGGEHWLLASLEGNSLLDWTPRAPVRLYYGNRDIDVTPDQALLAQQTYAAAGADAVAISVGDVDHDGTVLPAVQQLRAWFDAISAAAATPAGSAAE